jgi:hypothetical protein
MVYLKLLLIVAVFLALAMAGFAIKILLRKNGRFVNTHVEGNPALKKHGIRCAHHDEARCLGDTHHPCGNCHAHNQ